jgi:hypothetical protein
MVFGTGYKKLDEPLFVTFSPRPATNRVKGLSRMIPQKIVMEEERYPSKKTPHQLGCRRDDLITSPWNQFPKGRIPK